MRTPPPRGRAAAIPIALLCVALAAGARPAEAVDPARALTQYQNDRWETPQGLPQSTVQAMVRTRDGYLWVGTLEGLARFDGLSFTLFDGRTHPELGSGSVLAPMQDAEGSVWIGTWVGGLNRLRDRRFLVFGAPEGLSSDNTRAVLHARDGATWVATAGGGVNRIDGSTVTTYRAKDGLPSDETSSLCEDRDGALWIGTYTSGLARLRNDRITTFGVERDTGQPLSLPPGPSLITLRYAAVTLRDADRIRFRWRMEGLSGDWVDAGTDREAPFPNLATAATASRPRCRSMAPRGASLLRPSRSRSGRSSTTRRGFVCWWCSSAPAPSSLASCGGCASTGAAKRNSRSA